jgi:hypothetical protein
MDVESLYRLRSDIESIQKEEQQNVLNFMNIHGMSYTENDNGAFFNLSAFTENEINNLRKYVESVKENKCVTLPLPHPNREVLRLPGVNPMDWTKIETQPEKEEQIQVDDKKRKRHKAAKPTKQQQRMMKRMRQFCKKRKGPVRQRRTNETHETEDCGRGLDDEDMEEFDYDEYLDEDIEVEDLDDEQVVDLEDYGDDDNGEIMDQEYEDIQSEMESEEESNIQSTTIVGNSQILDVLEDIPTSLPLKDQWEMFIKMFPKLKSIVSAPQWM